MMFERLAEVSFKRTKIVKEKNMLCLDTLFYLICIPMTFNESIKACFFNKKYSIAIQICATQI